MYQTIFFDLDGTLTDSGPGITHSVAYALNKWNIKVEDYSVLNAFVGPPLAESFAKYYNFTPEQCQKSIEYYREYYVEKGMFENSVYPGIRELAAYLKDAGRKLVVATSKPEEFAVQIMEHFGLAQYFDRIAGASMDENRVEKARKQVADVIGAKSAEIFFTSGGTESDNWALKGVMRANEKKGRHLIISAIEHHAILHSAKALEREGFDVTVLPVDADGVVSPEAVEAAIRPDTVLVSIMAANNEIGTIEPLEAIGEVCKRHGVVFHTDAVQAFGHIPLNVEQMHIDLLSVSAHKFHGPKGVGFLYIRKGVKLLPFMDGGAQEKNRRAGTSNVAGIVGMGEAAQQAMENMDATMAKVAAVRDHLISRIEAEIPHAKLNGHRTNRLPGNVNFCFRFIEGESMLMLLDAQGVCASSGSACTSGSLDPSHVLLAIGCPHEIAHGSLRLSLSEETTMEDADFVVDQLKEIIPRLRSMSPLYADFIAENK